MSEAQISNSLSQFPTVLRGAVTKKGPVQWPYKLKTGLQVSNKETGPTVSIIEIQLTHYTQQDKEMRVHSKATNIRAGKK